MPRRLAKHWKGRSIGVEVNDDDGLRDSRLSYGYLSMEWCSSIGQQVPKRNDEGGGGGGAFYIRYAGQTPAPIVYLAL